MILTANPPACTATLLATVAGAARRATPARFRLVSPQAFH